MALKDGRGGREFDKFVADGSGNTGIRVVTTAHETLSTSGTNSNVNATSGNGDTIVAAYDITGKQRVGLQFVNGTSGSYTMTFKVWGSLIDSPGNPVSNADKWCQIGDDIAITHTEDTKYKAIATTPIKWITVTAIISDATGDSPGTTYLMAD